jgi:hypothetical protein
MDPTVQLGIRCRVHHGTAPAPVAAIGLTKITTGASSPGAMWMRAAPMEFRRVYMRAPQSHSSVTSLAAALQTVTATLLGMQAGTMCGLPVAHMILQVERRIRCTNPAIAHVNFKASS